MTTVIIGLGNPELADDGVGIRVAEMLRAVMPAKERVIVRAPFTGGLRLVDAMLGFERAIIIDGVSTGINPPGTVVHLAEKDLQQARNLASDNDLDLPTALKFAHQSGVTIPTQIEAWGIEISDATSISEHLTPAVRAAVPQVVSEICRSTLRYEAQSTVPLPTNGGSPVVGVR